MLSVVSMDSVEPRLRTSYFVRIGMLVVLCAFIFLGMWVGGHKTMPVTVFFVGITPLCVLGYIYLREYWRGPQVLDATGVTRRDGKRFCCLLAMTH